MHTVHLVDASPYIFRAYFALPEMRGSSGERIEAIYGFVGFLLKFLADERPTHLGVAFDESLTTSFRNELYPAYKAQRELPPEELVAQLQTCRAFAAAMGAAEFAHERYEADDLIGTLTRALGRQRQRVVVVTSDKDLAQLVGPEVELFDYARGERYGPREVAQKFGVEPRQIPDYLGLAGDSVDNIPGVRGVGKKTAVALLSTFADLDALYADLDRVRELDLRGARTLAERLGAGRDLAFLSRDLATIACDAPVRAGLRALTLRRPDLERIDDLCASLGAEGLRDRIHAWSDTWRSAPESRPR